MGFMAIKKLQSKTVDAILAERKAGDFQSLNDFLVRVDIDLADAMALTNAGCFAELEPEMNHKEIAFKVANFYLQDGVGEPVQIPYSREPLTHQERITLETESFGFPISEHPLKRYLPVLGERVRKAEDIPKLIGQTINLAGVYITRKVTSTRQREPMEFVTFEDETDIFECVMFPDSYKEFGDLLNWESLFVIRGKVEVAFGVYTITVEKLGSLRRVVDKLTPRKEGIIRKPVMTETRYATEW